MFAFSSVYLISGGNLFLCINNSVSTTSPAIMSAFNFLPLCTNMFILDTCIWWHAIFAFIAFTSISCMASLTLITVLNYFLSLLLNMIVIWLLWFAFSVYYVSPVSSSSCRIAMHAMTSLTSSPKTTFLFLPSFQPLSFCCLSSQTFRNHLFCDLSCHIHWSAWLLFLLTLLHTKMSSIKVLSLCRMCPYLLVIWCGLSITSNIICMFFYLAKLMLFL